VRDVGVLVVDDQEPFRRAMSAVVDATDGFTVLGTADSGEACLEVAERLQPDLVLLDVKLPGIDGMEACRRLRATAGGPVVVLLSTYDEDELDVSACGARAYVPKAEFGPDALTAVWGSSGA
jgi:DNA-binding NarL/FixJ family response regulator